MKSSNSVKNIQVKFKSSRIINRKNKLLTKRSCKKFNERKVTVLSDNIKDVNSIKDLMADGIFDAWHSFKIENDELQIECYHALQLDDCTKDWAFNLCKQNTKHMYENSIGWDEEGKRKEMFESSSRYLIAKISGSKEPVAFSHFRFDLDYGEEVLYCYELHVTPKLQGRGVGKFLLNLLQLLAFTYKMSKIILTVFKSNRDGIRFYQKSKFEEDHTSPKESSYVILSKYKEDWEQ